MSGVGPLYHKKSEGSILYAYMLIKAATRKGEVDCQGGGVLDKNRKPYNCVEEGGAAPSEKALD